MEPIKIIIEIVVRTDGNAIAKVYPEEAGNIPIAMQSAPMPPIPHTITTVFRCNHWVFQQGDKEPRSCEGCKVACQLKGRYKGEEMTI